MENKNIGIGFGILAEPLAKQLKKQGFKFNVEKIKYFEREREAINTLRFGSNLLTDSMVDKIIPKLYKKIIAHVAKENKLKIVTHIK